MHKQNINVLEMTEQIRKNILNSPQSRKETFLQLIPNFNRFFRDTIKTGDYDHFKKENPDLDTETLKKKYINDLASIFLENILPIDLENPDKYKDITDSFANLYIKMFIK
ncbi:MAG: hypothetical protein ACFFDY_07385 [Candidatus Thorarchaeota archaeon]